MKSVQFVGDGRENVFIVTILFVKIRVDLSAIAVSDGGFVAIKIFILPQACGPGWSPMQCNLRSCARGTIRQ